MLHHFQFYGSETRTVLHTTLARRGAAGAAATPGKPGPEDEKKQLQAELGVTAARVQAQEATSRQLQEELAALRQQAAQDAATSADVLASQQREQQRLEGARRELERQLAEARQDVAQLQLSLQAALDAAAAASAAAAAAAGGGDEQQGGSACCRTAGGRRRGWLQRTKTWRT